MNKSNIKAYAALIHTAALNRRDALQFELGVGFAVMLDSWPSKRLARAQLQKIYADAGYKCREPSDIDWKTINRRIAGSFALFDFLGEKDIRGWAGDLQKAPLVEAIVEKLKPLKLNTLNEVVQICKGSKERASNAPGRKPGVKVETMHLKFSIPPTASAEELLEAAGKLMTMAQDMVNARQHEAANHDQEQPQREALAA